MDPNFAEAQAELGVAYAKTGQAEQALHQYEVALTVQANFALVDSNKAAALVMLSRWEEARSTHGSQYGQRVAEASQ